jgi:hypothetical protein
VHFEGTVHCWSLLIGLQHSATLSSAIYWMNSICPKRTTVMPSVPSSARLEFHYLASMPSSNQPRRKNFSLCKPHSHPTSGWSNKKSERCNNQSAPSLRHSAACLLVHPLGAKVCSVYCNSSLILIFRRNSALQHRHQSRSILKWVPVHSDDN